MATHAPRAIARQPFASLDGARLQRLQNTKNRQNALPTQLSPSTKRRYSPPALDDEQEDGENIDPALLSPKRAKNLDHADFTKSSRDTVLAKRSQFVLVDAPPSPDELLSPVKPTFAPIANRPIAKPISRLNRAGISAAQVQLGPTVVTSQLKSSIASTAGRSPKSKRHGILNKRRTAAPFFRVDPPSKSRASEPLSLDAALGGTLPGYSARSRSATASSSRGAASLAEKPMKEGWFFDIHEDTFEEALTNMMEFSTGVLDISDDEDRRRAKNERGKENIPPEAMAVVDEAPVTESIAEPRSAAGRPMASSKEPKSKRTINPFYRAPLADLPTTDFYEESLLSSASLEPSSLSEHDAEDDECAAAVVQGSASIDQVIAAAAATTTEVESLPPKVEPELQAWPLVEPEMPVFGSHQAEKTEEGEIQIWESESAAGDADNQDGESLEQAPEQAETVTAA